MDNKTIGIIAVVAIVIAAVVGIIIITNGGSNPNINPGDPYTPDTAGKTFTDAAGRTVTVPNEIASVATIGGTGPLRFTSCFDMYEWVVEVDKGDVTDKKNGRAYSYAYPYDSFPESQYHADNSIDTALVEKLGNIKPSVTVTSLSLYNNNAELFNNLAKITTLVVLENQQMGVMFDSNGKLSDYLQKNFNMLGTVFGKEKRASELISEIEGIYKDIRNLSSTGGDMDVYVAGVTISGSNTLNTTFPVYLPFNFTNTTNAYKGGSTASKVVLTEEEFAQMNIDRIVIDPSSSDKISDPSSQNVLKYIYGINNDDDKTNDIDMYITVPIVWDSINYDCALASGYYVAYLQYGKLTHNQLLEKINNIFKVFYGSHGSDVLKDMEKFFVGKSSANNQEMPLLEEVEIAKNGDVYSIVAKK